MELLAKNLRFLRSRKDLSRTEFCKEAGFNYGTFTRYEDGSAEPGISTLIKLSQFFSVSIDSLVTKDLSSMTIQEPQDSLSQELKKIKDQMDEIQRDIEKLKRPKT